MSVRARKSVLVDESVWLALCLDMGVYGEEAARFFQAATGSVDLLVSGPCLQDLWTDLCHVLRYVVTREGGTIDERVEALVLSIAWECIAYVREVAMVVMSGPAEAKRAESLRKLHAEYREALLVATAEECKATCIVTLQESLRDCLPVRCLSPKQAVLAFDLEHE